MQVQCWVEVVMVPTQLSFNLTLWKDCSLPLKFLFWGLEFCVLWPRNSLMAGGSNCGPPFILTKNVNTPATQRDDLFTFTHLGLTLGLKPVFPEMLPMRTSVGFCLPGILFPLFTSSLILLHSNHGIPASSHSHYSTPGLHGHKLGPSAYFFPKFK